MEIVTVAERKARATAVKREAIDAMRVELAEAARRLGGRYLVFGSAARGEVRWDSDLDLLLDFPDGETMRTAWTVAEQACGRHDLECDIVPLTWCTDAFLAHVMPKAVEVR